MRICRRITAKYCCNEIARKQLEHQNRERALLTWFAFGCSDGGGGGGGGGGDDGKVTGEAVVVVVVDADFVVVAAVVVVAFVFGAVVVVVVVVFVVVVVDRPTAFGLAVDGCGGGDGVDGSTEHA